MQALIIDSFKLLPHFKIFIILTIWQLQHKRNRMKEAFSFNAENLLPRRFLPVKYSSFKMSIWAVIKSFVPILQKMSYVSYYWKDSSYFAKYVIFKNYALESTYMCLISSWTKTTNNLIQSLNFHLQIIIVSICKNASNTICYWKSSI